ncbi:tRNA (adenosine(37)-N6)-dimethylallyltransferase MiaA [Leeia oryzae]|uniref:tRNA (adenosine(37)-N6)-dimethylallyltransferase MiaA n=1 Tax=Leeia oryzae TaxID=356662 RepID=UPI000375F116|nr:tRNA (adenosine(37)-N6)-dimethylallyltransferase MiaA [Leeia oryzae]
MPATVQPKAILLAGPTASGKTASTLHLCRTLPVEIISVDSALVYRDMNIGTAKPDAGFLAEAPHFLLDIIDPTDSYSAAQFRTDALQLMDDITRRGHIPLLVGGTMLYYKALLEGLSDLPEADPEIRATLEAEAAQIGWPAMHQKLATLDPVTAARLEPGDSQRVQRALEICLVSGEPMSALLARQTSEPLAYQTLNLALVPSDRAVLHQRIAERFDQMLAMGFIDEVRALLNKYPTLTPELPSMRCVGYRQALAYLAGEDDLPAFREKGIAATRQLAKRQLTWLRGMTGWETVDSLQPGLPEAIGDRVRQWIKQKD